MPIGEVGEECPMEWTWNEAASVCEPPKEIQCQDGKRWDLDLERCVKQEDDATPNLVCPFGWRANADQVKCQRRCKVGQRWIVKEVEQEGAPVIVQQCEYKPGV